MIYEFNSKTYVPTPFQSRQVCRLALEKANPFCAAGAYFAPNWLGGHQVPMPAVHFNSYHVIAVQDWMP